MQTHLQKWALGLAIILSILVMPVKSQATEQYKYYALVLASFEKDRPDMGTHSFATFVKVDEQLNLIEKFDISWLPNNKKIHIYDIVNSYQGKNFTLDETLQWTKENNLVVERTKLMAIDETFFSLAKTQARKLESGFYSYKVINMFSRTFLKGMAINCVQAIGLIDPNVSWPDWSTARGRSATYLWLEKYGYTKAESVEEDHQVILNQVFSNSFIPEIIE